MELPEGCIAAILSCTTPKDACRLSLVSKSFRSAVDFDVVWDHFLPFDLHSIVSRSPSKKALYLSLYDHPVIIDEGKMSLQLDRMTGKKCYFLGAKALSINVLSQRSLSIEGWTPQQRTLPESRFPVVAELGPLWCPLRIRGMINTLSLSPSTQYGAFLVFKIIDVDGYYNIPLLSSVIIVDSHEIPTAKHFCWKSHRLEDEARLSQRPIIRIDGCWLEIEIGETFNSGFENKDLHMIVVETNRHSKARLIIEGIELRPKEDNSNMQMTYTTAV